MRALSTNKRHWCSGNIIAFQAIALGSIPEWRTFFGRLHNNRNANSLILVENSRSSAWWSVFLRCIGLECVSFILVRTTLSDSRAVSVRVPVEATRVGNVIRHQHFAKTSVAIILFHVELVRFQSIRPKPPDPPGHSGSFPFRSLRSVPQSQRALQSIADRRQD